MFNEKELTRHIKNHLVDFVKSSILQSLASEHRASQLRKGKLAPPMSTGFDYTCIVRAANKIIFRNAKIEHKATHTALHGGTTFRIRSFQKKRLIANFIEIVDTVNGRLSFIPSKVFFRFIGTDEEFIWSTRYEAHSRANTRIGKATRLFLKHEQIYCNITEKFYYKKDIDQ